MLVAERQSATLRTLVRTITNTLASERLSVTDMSHAGALEFDRTISLNASRSAPPYTEIRRLEGPIEARYVPRDSGASPIRYFLDGSQKTLPVWRVGSVPIIASVTAIAILHRSTPANVNIVAGTFAARMRWILPRYTGNDALDRIVHLLESMGEHIVDPMEEDHRNDPELYHRLTGSYPHLLQQAYAAANQIRERDESNVLQFWRHSVSPSDPNGWIVVDGPLTTDTLNAIGLVKDARAQHFEGSEAAVLYDLQVGQRTSAYTLANPLHREGAERAMWYLRMQNASGLDARHGLIRLETPDVLSDPDLVDHISSWILAERAPRASTDARWATLIYPIHLLERMLKRRIDALTTGWPT